MIYIIAKLQLSMTCSSLVNQGYDTKQNKRLWYKKIFIKTKQDNKWSKYERTAKGASVGGKNRTTAKVASVGGKNRGGKWEMARITPLAHLLYVKKNIAFRRD